MVFMAENCTKIVDCFRAQLATIRSMSRTVVYFTRELPGLSEDLSERGLEVYEALAISEVFYLCEQHPNSTVVIDSTVPDEAAAEVARQQITLRLKPEATVADVFWELSPLSGSADVVH